MLWMDEGPLRSFGFQPPPLPPSRVSGNDPVLDRILQDLREASNRLVDRIGRENTLTRLHCLVAIYFPGCDFAKTMLLEERKQVVGQRPFVVNERPLAESLVPLPLEPLGCKLVECRVVGRKCRFRRWRMPDSSADICEDVC